MKLRGLEVVSAFQRLALVILIRGDPANLIDQDVFLHRHAATRNREKHFARVGVIHRIVAGRRYWQEKYHGSFTAEQLKALVCHKVIQGTFVLWWRKSQRWLITEWQLGWRGQCEWLQTKGSGLNPQCSQPIPVGVTKWLAQLKYLLLIAMYWISLSILDCVYIYIYSAFIYSCLTLTHSYTASGVNHAR